MRPLLLRLGPIVLHSYPTLINLGLVGGAVLAYLRARHRGLDAVRTLDAALAAALGGLIVARAAYVGLHWDYYGDHVRQALRLRHGGLAWQGACVGGFVAAAITCAIQRSSLAATLDVLTPGAALLAVSAWLGCLMVGCAYGVETYPDQKLLWALSLDLPDLYGIRAPRVAVQLLGAGWSALVLALILVVERRFRRRGVLLPLWLVLHSLGSFALGFLRADEVPIVAGWRIDQLADLVLATAGVATFLGLSLGGRSRDETP